MLEKTFTILPDIHYVDTIHADAIAVWLDNTICTSIESQWFNIARQLRQIISHVQVFTSVYECIDCIRSSGIERIFLIVAGTYADDFDTKLFEEIMDNVFFYVFTLNKPEYTSHHPRIRGCFDDINSLINRLHTDYTAYLAEIVSDIDSTSVNSNESTTRCINPQLIQWKCLHLMMDIVRKLPCPREQSMYRLIQNCSLYFKNDSRALEEISTFRETYEPRNIVKWYVSHNFLGRLLYESLQTKNIDEILNLSFVLLDIYDELNELQCKQRMQSTLPDVVYSGQVMEIDKLHHLKANIGRLITNNIMLPTSIHRNVAERFAGKTASQNHASVLTEYSFNSSPSDLKPFANVSTLAHKDGQVLFTNGHIFRIDSCHPVDGNKWFVKLTVCDNSNPIVQNSSDYFDISILELLKILPKISPKTDKANDRMLQCWRLYCKDDPIEQTKVDQFEEGYRSDSAIRWYTKDSLLYHLLNTALRQENIDMIIDFRYFIIDLYEQLTKAHLDYVRSFKEPSLTVYRGQKISLLELRRIKHNVGKYISITSLFSASTSSEVALLFAELSELDRKQFLQSILFQIDIDMEKLARSGKNYVFANIMNMSRIVDEKEVLFMVNTQFKIKSITKWSGALWVVHLTLLSYDDANSNDMRIMNQYLSRLTNMVTEYYGDNIRSYFKRRL